MYTSPENEQPRKLLALLHYYKFQLHFHNMHNFFVYLAAGGEIYETNFKFYDVATRVRTGNKNLSGMPINIVTGETLDIIFYPVLVYATEILGSTLVKIKCKSWSEMNDRLTMGLADISTMRIRDIPMSRSLFPMDRVEYNIWVPNLEYEHSADFFIKSFTWQLWVAFAVALIAVVLCIWVSKKLFGNMQFSLFNYFWNLLGQTEADDVMASKLWSYMIITCSGLTVSIIFSIAFDAFLTALLAIETIKLPFNDLTGLLASEFKICAAGASYDILTANKSDSAMMKRMSIEGCPNLDIQYGPLSSLNQTDVAFILQDKSFVTVKLRNKYKLVQLTGSYFQSQSNLYVYEGFMYREQYNRALIKIRSVGIVCILQERALQKMKDKTTYDAASEKSLIFTVDFTHITIILGIFCVGVILSFAVLIIEIVLVKGPENINLG